jgi:hypothetical protein
MSQTASTYEEVLEFQCAKFIKRVTNMPNHTQLSVKDGQLALYTSILTLYCVEKVTFICPPTSSIIILFFFPIHTSVLMHQVMEAH